MGIVHTVLILLASFLNPGAVDAVQQPMIVTRIQVETQMPDDSQLVTYESQEEMTQVLMYLRRMEILDRKPIDPDTFRAETYRITMDLWDGSDTCYRQLHRQYLRKNDGPWRGIVPADGLLFPPG